MNIFIVDDDPMQRMITVDLLESAGEKIHDFDSGSAMLAAIDTLQPDIVLLDIEMPGLNGIETCQKLRNSGVAEAQVIFVSGCDDLETRLAAYEAGGNDFISKSALGLDLLSKVILAKKNKIDRDQIASEKESYEQMAMTFLDSIGESGVLQNYSRANIDCPDYTTLLDRTFEATRFLRLECHIQLRFSGGSLSCTPLGPAGALEESILTQVAGMGRLFQFKDRLVTNFDHITIIIMNMPENPEVAGRVRDNIAILAEIADALVKVIELRNESAARAEKIIQSNKSASSAIDILRSKYRLQQAETRLLLEKLTNDIETTYPHLGLLDSQENTISDVLYKNTEEILCLFDQSEEFEKQFAIILNSLGP